MKWADFRLKARALVFRTRVERDLDEELDFHVEMQIRKNLSLGMSPEEARRQALLKFGGVPRVAEECRDARGLNLFDNLLRDIRYGARALAASPGFTAVALLTLSIGIGAATAIFSQVNAVFWRTLPVRQPEELRTLVWTSLQRGFLNTPAFPGPRLPSGETFASYSYPAYVAMRDGTRDSFSDLACWMDPGEMLPVVMGELGFGSVQFVSGNYFRMLGIGAAMGRTIQPGDDREGAPAAVAVVSHRFWQQTFGQDPGVLSRTINLNGNAFTIIGVLREDFFGLDPSISPDLMVPITMFHIASAGGAGVLAAKSNWSLCRVAGRIRPGVADEQARASAEYWTHQGAVDAAWPPRGRPFELPKLWILEAGQGIDGLRSAAARPVLILMAVVGIIVLAACSNIAGLLLARSASRQREIATRLAIGASRGRLVRQFLTESVLLSAAGGTAGIALAWALHRLTESLLSQFMPVVNGADRQLGVTATPDIRVLAFSASVVLLTGVLFGLAPALGSTRVDLISAMRQAATGGMGRRFRFTGGKTMVALQTALSMLLLIGAGLFIRSIVNLRSVELGYEPRGLLYVRVEPRTGGMQRDTSSPQAVRETTIRRSLFFEEVVRHLANAPGVLSASASLGPPLSDYEGAGATSEPSNACTSDLNPEPGGATFVLNSIAPRFFETMRIPLVLGRDLEWSDRVATSRQRVAVVNQSFVKKFFAPGRNPIGATFGVGRDCPNNTSFVTVIGVAADSRLEPRTEAGPMIYQLYSTPARPLTLILRSGGNPEDLIPGLRRSMAEFNAGVPLFGEATPVYLRDQKIRQERLLGRLLVIFGSFALLLCCLGVYGMLSYAASRRTSEIGLRMALGARNTTVIRMIVTESLTPVAAGLALGIVAALWLSRLVESMLYGISTNDPATIAGAVLLFLMIASVAAAIPAVRASRIDPLRALRHE